MIFLFFALFLLLALPAGRTDAQVSVGQSRPSDAETEILRTRAENTPRAAAGWARYAEALIARENVEDRLRAQKALKRAVSLEPDNVDYRLALADLYYRQGYLTLARRQLNAAVRRSPDAAPVYTRLGRIALRDWLKYQRQNSLEVARHYWQDAARRAPGDPEPWLGLGVISILNRDAAGAVAAGRQVLASGKGLTPQKKGEALLLLGAGSYGLGWAARSDSAFGAALPYLAGPIREHLLDITPAATDADTASLNRLFDSGSRERFLETFWRSRDPDLTTAVNEVRLEFLARATVAYFLFYDARRRDWDERARYLVRYGIPNYTEYNPIIPTGTLGISAANTNRLVWHYPALGFNVYLEDRYLNEFYDLPVMMTWQVDFSPDPDMLKKRVAEGLTTQAGRGVFRTTLPDRAPLRGTPTIALFRRVQGFDPRISAAPYEPALSVGGSGGPGPGATATPAVARRPAARVEAYLAVTSAESSGDVVAEAVVFQDSSYREVARATSRNYVWCQDDTTRVFQFNFDLPVGQYVIGMAARDSARKGDGAWKSQVLVSPSLPGRLEVSDLELACGMDPGRRDTPFAKTEYAVYPNPLRQVPRDQSFGFYFEIYNLITNDENQSQVSIEYTIKSTKKDKRPFFVKFVDPKKRDPVLEVARVNDVAGRARYQYVSASLAGQPVGPYRIEVKVTDLANTYSVTRAMEFELVD
ncbi:MAG: tetratricopeptide repeat protein [Candidatus Eiseniibacteriota bacterium]